MAEVLIKGVDICDGAGKAVMLADGGGGGGNLIGSM